jgi:hypothetical protein
MSATSAGTVGIEAWDTEWAAEKAAEALRYLGRDYPECLENLRVLDKHETAAHEAALLGDREGGSMEAGVLDKPRPHRLETPNCHERIFLQWAV